jgi:hypothetical protein
MIANAVAVAFASAAGRSPRQCASNDEVIQSNDRDQSEDEPHRQEEEHQANDDRFAISRHRRKLSLGHRLLPISEDNLASETFEMER